MINYLHGTIHAKQAGSITVLTSGGVGYQVAMTKLSLLQAQVGQEVSLPIYTKVSDSAIQLFGFDDDSQKEFFQLLLSVKNVGPKSALNILSIGSIDDIKDAIARGDAKYLSAVQGMGKKTAERLVVELKEKISKNREQKEVPEAYGERLAEVIDALVSLGYSRDEAKTRVNTLAVDGKSTEELLKIALTQ